MKAVVIEQYGGKEQLKEKEVQKPEIADDQVLVEIYSTSINPIDWKVREGYLRDRLLFEFPIILGWDAAGIIKKVGKNSTKFQVGDKVFTRPATTRMGTYAQYCAVEEHLVASIPDNITFEQAASVPLAGLTAWQCLVDFGKIKSGEKVLIHAGSGGLGTFAIQIAKSFGAYVAATASGKNSDLLKILGADRVVNYQEEAFDQVLENYDFVLDTIGGEVQEQSFHVLKKGGKLASIVQPPSEDMAKEFHVNAGFIWLEPNGEQLAELGKLMENGQVKPVIGQTFPFNEKGIKDAHEVSESHHAKGKIVINVK
jgi:NADPH:quinone reductase-like Zn-dependent oxidoreductase